MLRKIKLKRATSVLASLTLLTVTSLVLVSTTLASPAASKAQGVAIEVKSTIGSSEGTFVLTPLGSGSLKSDTGALTLTVSQKKVVRSGQSVIIFTITSTWTGQGGTMVIKERFDDVAGGSGYRVGTGTWTIVSAKGTGEYAGLRGSGRAAYAVPPRGSAVFFHYEGLVTKP